jgi:hypothetical protein
VVCLPECAALLRASLATHTDIGPTAAFGDHLDAAGSDPQECTKATSQQQQQQQRQWQRQLQQFQEFSRRGVPHIDQRTGKLAHGVESHRAQAHGHDLPADAHVPPQAADLQQDTAKGGHLLAAVPPSLGKLKHSRSGASLDADRRSTRSTSKRGSRELAGLLQVLQKYLAVRFALRANVRHIAQFQNGSLKGLVAWYAKHTTCDLPRMTALYN